MYKWETENSVIFYYSYYESGRPNIFFIFTCILILRRERVCLLLMMELCLDRNMLSSGRMAN